jgi:hypothetical protein
MGGKYMNIKKLIFILIIGIVILPSQSSVGSIKNQKIVRDFDNFNEQNGNIISMIEIINYSILFAYLEKIVSFGIRYVGSENCRKAAEYINEEFLSLGLDSYIDEWRYRRYKCQNVISTKNGTDPTSDAVIILTAHLDTTKNSVGANDDASGVATILSIANVTSKYQFNHTIKFVITSGEERGLFGSFDYVKNAYRRNENIIANINIDTIANSTCGHLIDSQTPERSYWLYTYTNEICKKYNHNIDMKVQLGQHYPADSQSFLDYGYDSFSFNQPKVSEYPFHTPEDTLDKINYFYYENVTKLILALTAELANKEIELQVRFEAPMEGFIHFFKIPILRLPGFNICRTRVRGITYFIGKPIARINITSKDEITTVTYSIDGSANPKAVFTELPYEWRIQKNKLKLFRLRGIHKLGVRVYSISGETAYDEMDFYAITPI